MSGPKKMMVNLLFVGLFAVVALLAYTYVGVFGLILSLDIVLDHFIPGYSVCSGQQKPDSKLSFFSATAGGSPSLSW
jgi:hypothetical protein